MFFEGHGVRGSLMLSWTTVDSIWLSGLGGMPITLFEESKLHPSFETYASNSDPDNIESHLNAISKQGMKITNPASQDKTRVSRFLSV